MKRPIIPMSPSIAPAANEGVGGVIGYGPALRSNCALPHPSWPTADRSDPIVVVHGKLLEKPAFLSLAQSTRRTASQPAYCGRADIRGACYIAWPCGPLHKCGLPAPSFRQSFHSPCGADEHLAPCPVSASPTLYSLHQIS